MPDRLPTVKVAWAGVIMASVLKMKMVIVRAAANFRPSTCKTYQHVAVFGGCIKDHSSELDISASTENQMKSA